MIYQEVYTSVADTPMAQSEIQAILTTSRRNNTRDGLSGLLVAHEDRFMQVLEGPQDMVQACLARINTDPRHKRVRVLMQQSVPDRVFSEWRMGFARPEEMRSASRNAVFSLYDLTQGRNVALGNDDMIARQVRSFLASFGLLGLAGAPGRTAAGTAGRTSAFGRS